MVAASSISAKARSFPSGFQIRNVKTTGATIYVRHGGKGPAVVLLHGFGDTGDMWAPVAAALVKHHTVVVPDLRGMGLSSHPPGGYDKKTQAHDIAQMLDRFQTLLKCRRVARRFRRREERAKFSTEGGT